MATIEPVVVPLGDAAVLVELGSAVGLEESRRVHALARRILAATDGEPGWGAPVPGACSVLVPVDPLDPGVNAASGRLADLAGTLWREMATGDSLEATEPEPELEPLVIPTRYGGEDGPDLEAVAEMLGMEPSEVIDRHAAPTYTVLFLGFAPGFAYLGPLPGELVLPRRPTPRTHVPRGSVAIAGPQTAIYPIDSPGGWWLIGRTDVEVWDAGRASPALFRPGSPVRFVPEGRG